MKLSFFRSIAPIVPLFILISCGGETPEPVQKPDGELVKETFAAYKQATLAKDAQGVVNVADRNTFDYYDQVFFFAMEADSAQVRAFELFDQLMVLGIRQSIPKDEIESMNARELFKYAIEVGMIGEGEVETLDIGDVEVIGQSARGRLIVEGAAQRLFFNFNKEDGVWKMDLTSLFPVARIGVANRLQRSEQTEDEFINATIEQQTGQKPGPDIWKPMKQQ